MHTFYRFTRRVHLNYINMFGALSLSGYIIYKIINPFFQMLFFCCIASYVYGTENITPWVIGNALVLCFFSAFFGVGQTFVTERWQGTLASLVSSPTNTIYIVLPRVATFVVDSFLSICVGFLTGFIFFGFRLSLDQLGPFILIIFVSIFSALGFGLLIGSFALLTRDIYLLLNIASLVMLALTGANFHISALPDIMQKISGLLPLTRSIQLMRFISDGIPIGLNIYLLYGEILLGFLYFTLGFSLYKYIERLSIKYASIDLY